ncbi:MAG: AI-2E family transporter [Alphaproteobacteria bacterium]
MTQDQKTPLSAVSSANATPAGAANAGVESAPVEKKKKKLKGFFSARTLAILAVLYTIYLAQDILMPITVAILLYLVLLPILRLLTRLHIPQALGAGLITLSLIAAIGVSAFTLAAPIADWISRVPTAMGQIESRLAVLRKPVDEVKKATEQVEKLTDIDGDKAKPQAVVVQAPGIMERVFSGLRAVGAQLAMILLLLMILLASGEMFKEKLVKIMPRLTDKKRAVTIMRSIEGEISNYLLTVTLINAGLGIATGVGLWAIGMTNAPLWGVMAAILNFIPYVGGIIGGVVVFAAALLALPTLTDAFFAIGIYFAIQLIESELVTPAIVGRRLSMNMVVIAVSLIFWAWMWGVMGALLAVPILVFCKVLCDNIDGLKVVGEFISRREIRHEAPAADAQQPI